MFKELIFAPKIFFHYSIWDVIVKDGKNLASAANLEKCAKNVAKDGNCKRTFYYSQDLQTCVCVAKGDSDVFKAAHFPGTNTKQYYLTMGKSFSIFHVGL